MTVIQVPYCRYCITLFPSSIRILSEKPSLPTPIPALEKVEAGKPFIFNWPVGDSVYIIFQILFLKQVEGIDVQHINDRELVSKIKNKDYVVRPVDKKDHYIKRCVASPGDSLKIIDAQLYINGVPAKKSGTYAIQISSLTNTMGVTLNKKNWMIGG